MKTESLKRGREAGKKELDNQIEKKKVLTEAVEILAKQEITLKATAARYSIVKDMQLNTCTLGVRP